MDFLRQQDSKGESNDRRSLVSILVLLDFLRQHIDGLKEVLNKECFNPCFIGLPASTSKIIVIAVLPEMFQSLFYWTSCVNTLGMLGLAASGLSFNPCFIGLPASTWSLQFTHKMVGMFQSLFYWTSCVNSTILLPTSLQMRVSILVLLDFLRQPMVVSAARLRV